MRLPSRSNCGRAGPTSIIDSLAPLAVQSVDLELGMVMPAAVRAGVVARDRDTAVRRWPIAVHVLENPESTTHVQEQATTQTRRFH
jgi:hypothetical protein